MTLLGTKSRGYGLIDAINPDELQLLAHLVRDIIEGETRADARRTQVDLSTFTLCVLTASEAEMAAHEARFDHTSPHLASALRPGRAPPGCMP